MEITVHVDQIQTIQLPATIRVINFAELNRLPVVFAYVIVATRTVSHE